MTFLPGDLLYLKNGVIVFDYNDDTKHHFLSNNTCTVVVHNCKFDQVVFIMCNKQLFVISTKRLRQVCVKL